jgi:hypothetical protein
MATCRGGSTAMPYWWDGIPEERYWLEIRWEPGIGRDLACLEKPNPWYDLVGEVRPGDVVYHWHAREHRFVGRSEVGTRPIVRRGWRYVTLRGFVPIQVEIGLKQIRAHEPRILKSRDRLEAEHPGYPLYLPFQFRADGLRMMPNYFTKLPARLVSLLFDHTGLGEEEAAPPPEEEGSPSDRPERGRVRGSFLKPFKRRADREYVAHVQGGEQRRGRRHEGLVANFAEWLERRGFEVGYNAAIDLGLNKPPVVIEAKIVGPAVPRSIREAVGQLYEYRFFQVVDPKCQLVFLASRALLAKWVKYLERDRGIGVAWPDGEGFQLSRLAKRALRRRQG